MRFDQAHQQLFQSQHQGLHSAWARAAAEEARAERLTPVADAPRPHRPLTSKALWTLVCVLLTTAMVAAGAGTRPMEVAQPTAPVQGVVGRA